MHHCDNFHSRGGKLITEVESKSGWSYSLFAQSRGVWLCCRFSIKILHQNESHWQDGQEARQLTNSMDMFFFLFFLFFFVFCFLLFFFFGFVFFFKHNRPMVSQHLSTFLDHKFGLCPLYRDFDPRKLFIDDIIENTGKNSTGSSC